MRKKRELIPFLLENLYLFLSVEQLMRYIEGTKGCLGRSRCAVTFSDFIQDIDQSIGNIESFLSGSPGLLDQKGRKYLKIVFLHYKQKHDP